jgi:hypothetical protein
VRPAPGSRPWIIAGEVIEPTPLPGRLFAYLNDAGQDDEADEDELLLEAIDVAPRATAEHAARVTRYARLVLERGWIWDNLPAVPARAIAEPSIA